MKLEKLIESDMSGVVVSVRLNEDALKFIDKICSLRNVDRSCVIQRMIYYFWVRMVIYKDYELYPPLDEIKRMVNWSANGISTKKINIRLPEDTIMFIDKISENSKKTRSEVIRNIIEFFLITTSVKYKENKYIGFE